MDPVAIGLAVLQAAPWLIDVIGNAVPGPMEEQYRKDVESEGKYLRENQSGFTSGQRDAFRREGQNARQSQQQQQLAMLARGSAQSYDGGASGLQGNAARDAYKVDAQAGNQLESGIRNKDVAAYTAKKAAYNENLKYALELGYRRKVAALKAVKESDTGVDGLQAGKNQRDMDAAGLEGGADAVAPAAPAAPIAA